MILSRRTLIASCGSALALAAFLLVPGTASAQLPGMVIPGQYQNPFMMQQPIGLPIGQGPMGGAAIMPPPGTAPGGQNATMPGAGPNPNQVNNFRQFNQQTGMGFSPGTVPIVLSFGGMGGGMGGMAGGGMAGGGLTPGGVGLSQQYNQMFGLPSSFQGTGGTGAGIGGSPYGGMLPGASPYGSPYGGSPVGLGGVAVGVPAVGVSPFCTCGCTHSEDMVDELKGLEGKDALTAIEKSLKEISVRENLGLLTEKMGAHRARLQKLAKEIQDGKACCGCKDE